MPGARGRSFVEEEIVSAKDPGYRSYDELLKDLDEAQEKGGYPTNVKPTLEGKKFDEGKIRLELLAGEFLFGVATILTFGAVKYDAWNWSKGMKWSRVFGALMRHMWAWYMGRGPTFHNFAFGDLDDETKCSHLWHAGCCLMFLITYEMRGVGEDDRPFATTPPDVTMLGTDAKRWAKKEEPPPAYAGAF